MVKNYNPVCAEKYRLELIEILDEIIEYKPALFSCIGVTGLFNWRAIFDFSSEAWINFNSDYRTAIINALAEKRTLFISLLTFKTMYNEMNRPDIAGAAGLSLARLLEDITETSYLNNYNKYDMTISENCY